MEDFCIMWAALDLQLILLQLVHQCYYPNLSVKHDVNYVTNCDTTLESKKIAEGAEITLPTEELIKDGYIFDVGILTLNLKINLLKEQKWGLKM